MNKTHFPPEFRTRWYEQNHNEFMCWFLTHFHMIQNVFLEEWFSSARLIDILINNPCIDTHIYRFKSKWINSTRSMSINEDNSVEKWNIFRIVFMINTLQFAHVDQQNALLITHIFCLALFRHFFKNRNNNKSLCYKGIGRFASMPINMNALYEYLQLFSRWSFISIEIYKQQINFIGQRTLYTSSSSFIYYEHRFWRAQNVMNSNEIHSESNVAPTVALTVIPMI